MPGLRIEHRLADSLPLLGAMERANKAVQGEVFPLSGEIELELGNDFSAGKVANAQQ